MVESFFKSFCKKIRSKCMVFRRKRSSNSSSVEEHERELPDDIWALILGKVWIGDRARCRLVCKAWNLLLKSGYVIPALEPPWQILPESPNHPPIVRKIRFQSMSENRIYSFDVPTSSLENGGWCGGSSSGWQLMAVFPGLIVWWNPITCGVFFSDLRDDRPFSLTSSLAFI